MAMEAVLRIARGAQLARVADAVVVEDQVFYEGVYAGPEASSYNPLNPLENGLLLAEDFARLKIDAAEDIEGWYRHRGALMLRERIDSRTATWLVPLLTSEDEDSRIRRELGSPGRAARDAGEWPERPIEMARSGRSASDIATAWWPGDPLREILEQQATVRDALEVLVEPDAYRLDKVTARVTLRMSDVLDIRVELPREPYIFWMSVLQPIYFQLFIAVERAGRGLRAAARCRSCSQPFLILDGHRSMYCNRLCKSRFLMRELRAKRKAAKDER